MKEIDISNVYNIITACPLSINLMLLGDSGIGKTTVVERWCKNEDYFLKTLILSQLDASEALGVPVTVEEMVEGYDSPIKLMTSAIPKWVVELSQHKKAVLFLDEFLCADPSIMNSFLNLLSQKRVGQFDLSHVKFIAATNIGMYTFDPDFNILTRFCFFYVNNTSYKKDYPFVYTYSDPTEKDGLIFDKRRLVPRCAESLRQVPIEYLSDFYQGFTNEEPIMTKISVGLKNSDKVSEIVYNFCEKLTNPRRREELFVPNELLKPMAEALFKEFGQRGYNAVIKSIKIITEDQTNCCLNYLANNEFSIKNGSFK